MDQAKFWIDDFGNVFHGPCETGCVGSNYLVFRVVDYRGEMVWDYGPWGFQSDWSEFPVEKVKALIDVSKSDPLNPRTVDFENMWQAKHLEYDGNENISAWDVDYEGEEWKKETDE